jgi:hypothetical protein
VEGTMIMMSSPWHMRGRPSLALRNRPRSWPSIGKAGMMSENADLLARHFIAAKMIIVPRQARDNHREITLKKEMMRFLAVLEPLVD